MMAVGGLLWLRRWHWGTRMVVVVVMVDQVVYLIDVVHLVHVLDHLLLLLPVVHVVVGCPAAAHVVVVGRPDVSVDGLMRRRYRFLRRHVVGDILV